MLKMIMGIAMDSSMMVLRERVKHEIMIIVSLHYGDGDVKTRIEKRMMMIDDGGGGSGRMLSLRY